MATNNKIPKCPPLRFPDFNDDWTQCCISDYGDIVTGSTPSTSDPENYQENGFLWASPADINESKFIEATKTTLSLKGFNSTRKLPPYTVLVVCIGSTIGKMAMSKTVMATNQQINSIVVCEKYSPEFVYYAIDSRFPQYLTSVAVQAVPIISKSTFGALESCAPSLTEQKKIADFLSLIDERIHSLSETIKELKTQKAGLLNQLFSQKLRFPDFDDEWRVTTLGEIGETYTGLSGKSSENFGKGSPYITYKMVYDGVKINLCNTEYVYVSESEKQNQVRLGDILFTTSSETPEETGLCSVLLSSSDELYLNSFCFGYRLNEESLATSIFLGYALRSPIYRIKLSTLAQGSTRYNISKSEVMRMPISLPSLEEQKKIADFLSLVDERIEVEEQLLKKYEEQKKYLLRNMFV